VLIKDKAVISEPIRVHRALRASFFSSSSILS
jgi:hypothetical protein